MEDTECSPFLMLPHPLTNLEIKKYRQSELKSQGVYSRNNLPKTIKDGASIENIDVYKSTGTHWIDLCADDNIVAFFDSFVGEHIPGEIKRFINNKNIITNIFRIQAYDSVMCEYLCIGFIDFFFQ